MDDTRPQPRLALATAAVPLLAALAGVAWHVWAQHQYGGLEGCPNSQQDGHPMLLGLGLALLSAGVMTTAPKWARTSRRTTLILACVTAALVVVVVLFLYVRVVGGLGCFS